METSRSLAEVFRPQQAETDKAGFSRVFGMGKVRDKGKKKTGKITRTHKCQVDESGVLSLPREPLELLRRVLYEAVLVCMAWRGSPSTDRKLGSKPLTDIP
jgi:hypothetical protein